MCNHYEKNRQVIGWALDWFRSATGRDIELETMPEMPDHSWPKTLAPVLLSEPQRASIAALPWGIRREIKGKTKPLIKFVTNARDDKFASWTWRYCVAERRCLIPAVGYYEPDGPVGGKWEVRFFLTDRPMFFFAGLWDTDPDGATRRFTMVTTSPNELAARIHDRMPLILDDDGAREWLGHTPLPPDRLATLCRPYPAATMQSVALPPPRRPIKSADLPPAGGELELH